MHDLTHTNIPIMKAISLTFSAKFLDFIQCDIMLPLVMVLTLGSKPEQKMIHIHFVIPGLMVLHEINV